MIAESLAALKEAVLGVVRDNLELAGPIVFALGFAESIVLVSLFVPSTILFLGIGGLHSAAGGTFLDVWLWAAAGAAIGDVISYLVGRHFKHDVGRVWPVSRYPDLLPKGRAMIERHGFWAVFISKFIGALRPFVPVVAGVMDMPWALFVLASVGSSLVWAGVFLAPGYGVLMLPL